MKSVIALLLSTLSLTAVAHTLPTYSYIIHVSPPFGRVIINDHQTCPNDDEGIDCTVRRLESQSTLKITGIKNHACYFTVAENGELQLNDEKSFFCYVETKPAGPASKGLVKLPQHF